MAQYFPLFVSLEGRKILVVGAGVIAARRVCALQPFGPVLTVVAPQIAPEIRALPGVELRCRRFEDEDLAGVELAIIATNDPAENRRIAELCTQRGIIKNVSSEQGLCDFFFPALVRTEQVTVGLCSDGKDPSLTKTTRKRIQEFLNESNNEN